MKFKNAYFITGTAYAGKSTMVKLLAQKFDGIACEENYHDSLLEDLDAKEFPCLTYISADYGRARPGSSTRKLPQRPRTYKLKGELQPPFEQWL